ncbi:hypothetical protein [Streptomyces sp. NPDC088789]|uniref:hypothetical protein n=1 Tax=Streptomyces sp. NPDC088789 TaxID=3365899 RepID=UPI0037F5103F
MRGVPPGLPEELRALGRSLDRQGPDGPETMVERVLGQILAEHLAVPVAEPPTRRDRLRGRVRAARRWTRARRRSLTATLCGLLTVLALTPPVRAAVFDWFDFGGVEVRYDPSAPPPTPAEVPGCGPSVSLAEAGRRAGFRPLVPQALGPPDAVSVTHGPDRRFLVSLCWRAAGGAAIRLDQDAGRLDVGFVKTVREPVEWIPLSGPGPGDPGRDTALWFARPHRLSYPLLAADGTDFVREQRTAGPTLLWTHDPESADPDPADPDPDVGDVGAGPGDVTLRLEGVASLERAVEIAESLPPK